MKFKVGDRVLWRGRFKGTVRVVYQYSSKTFRYGVEFDEDVNGHDLRTVQNKVSCKNGHGWYVDEGEIKNITIYKNNNIGVW